MVFIICVCFIFPFFCCCLLFVVFSFFSFLSPGFPSHKPLYVFFFLGGGEGIVCLILNILLSKGKTNIYTKKKENLTKVWYFLFVQGVFKGPLGTLLVRHGYCKLFRGLGSHLVRTLFAKNIIKTA